MLERALERLTASPLVGAMATRFMGRIVGEAIAANQAIADKVPGLGSLLSLGTRAAAGMVGAADKQLDGLLADTAGKGGTLAVRRLNRIVVETLRDPTTREAVLQVWDLVAAEPVRGAGEHVSEEEVDGVVDAAHDLVVTTLAHPQTVALAHAVVDGFFEAFGGYTPGELLAELELDRADLVADLVRLRAGRRRRAARVRCARACCAGELAPFYDPRGRPIAGRLTALCDVSMGGGAAFLMRHRPSTSFFYPGGYLNIRTSVRIYGYATCYPLTSSRRAGVDAGPGAVLSADDAERLGRLLGLLADPVRVRMLFAWSPSTSSASATSRWRWTSRWTSRPMP